MNFSTLVGAVLEYLKDNHPTTPEECNFQAELKAASHWHWYKDNERTQFVSGPFVDEQLRKVAKVALRSWTHKLNEIESEAEKLQAKMQEAGEENDLSCNIEEQISGDYKHFSVSLLLMGGGGCCWVLPYKTPYLLNTSFFHFELGGFSLQA